MSEPKESKELFLRRKEKELQKKEEQIEQSLAEIAIARDSVDTLMQELEARELVMNEAEEKHGSLLKREEDVARRELEASDKERTVALRLEEIAKKDASFEELERTRKKEYEDKLFPLAAREQELIRREGEVHALEVELESKMRAFSKKVQYEEERDRQREKMYKEQESKLKEQTVAVDKKYNDAEALLAQVSEKSKAVKAEQVELESRDREVKWRDDQLRAAHQEAQETKNKLIKWERALAQREEELNVLSAELQLQKTTMESKELELGERLSKLLSAEKEVKDLEQDTTSRMQRVEHMESVATERINSTQQRESRISEDLAAVEATKAESDELVQLAQDKVAAATKLVKEVEERERALKDWIIELQVKEQQLEKREAQLGHGRGVGGVSPAPTSHGQGQVSATAGLSSMSLRQVQDLYIGATAKQAARVAAQKEAKRKPTDSSTMPDPFIARAEEVQSLNELKVDVKEMETQFSHWVARYYCIPNDRLETIFNKAEHQQFLSMLDAEDKFNEEMIFLAHLIGDENAGKMTGMNFTTVAQWQQFYNGVIKQAMARKRELLSVRLGHLATWNELFSMKAESFPEDFPKPPKNALKRAEDGEFAPRIHRRAPKPSTEVSKTSKARAKLLELRQRSPSPQPAAEHSDR